MCCILCDILELGSTESPLGPDYFKLCPVLSIANMNQTTLLTFSIPSVN